jgi:hypothetical protein
MRTVLPVPRTRLKPQKAVTAMDGMAHAPGLAT